MRPKNRATCQFISHSVATHTYKSTVWVQRFYSLNEKSGRRLMITKKARAMHGLDKHWLGLD